MVAQVARLSLFDYATLQRQQPDYKTFVLYLKDYEYKR